MSKKADIPSSEFLLEDFKSEFKPAQSDNFSIVKSTLEIQIMLQEQHQKEFEKPQIEIMLQEEGYSYMMAGGVKMWLIL